MKINVKSKSAITLIALIVTVIIMLILAGVSISTLMGESGLFSQARLAVNKYEEAVQNEEDILQEVMNEMNSHFSSTPSEPPVTPPVISDAKRTDGSWNETEDVNSPKLISGMTAIYFNGTTVVELEATDSETEWDKWYDYEAQSSSTATVGSGTSKWANAVTKDSSGNITGYYVWIPRYAYQITSGLGTNTKGNIDIEFLQGTTNNNKDNISISTGYPTVTNNAMDAYVVHPVFETDIAKGGFGVQLPGFWVAKYPAGFQKSTVNESGVLQNGSDTVQYSPTLKYSGPGVDYTPNAIGQDVGITNFASARLSYPVFKPLTYVYNCINLDSSYRIAQEMKNATGFYGLQNVDTHLLKNSEWGAVAYLTWSKYGRNGTEPNINNVNLNYKDNKNIYAVTGMYGAGVDTAHTNGAFTGNAYNTSEGQLGSSTGNITGVYDLNGCVFERVAGYIENTAGSTHRSAYGASLLSGDAKYRMIYLHDSSDTGNENYSANVNSEESIYGDAVLETSSSGSSTTGWNEDYSYFPYSSYPFFERGGFYGNEGVAGIFAFSSTTTVGRSGYHHRVPCGLGSGPYNPVPCHLL